MLKTVYITHIIIYTRRTEVPTAHNEDRYGTSANLCCRKAWLGGINK